MSINRKQKTCPHCGKRFIPWRAKAYCSESCRKNAQNVRLGYVRRDAAVVLPDDQNPEKIVQVNQKLANPFRRDEGFEWIACNEVTAKLTRKGSSDAAAYVFQIRDKGWFARIKANQALDRLEFSFGPSTRIRAQKAAEAKLMGHPFDKLEDEKSWTGDCLVIL